MGTPCFEPVEQVTVFDLSRYTLLVCALGCSIFLACAALRVAVFFDLQQYLGTILQITACCKSFVGSNLKELDVQAHLQQQVGTCCCYAFLDCRIVNVDLRVFYQFAHIVQFVGKVFCAFSDAHL